MLFPSSDNKSVSRLGIFLPSIVVFPSVVTSNSSALDMSLRISSNWFCLKLELYFLLCLFFSSSLVAAKFWSSFFSCTSGRRRWTLVVGCWVVLGLSDGSSIASVSKNKKLFSYIRRIDGCKGYASQNLLLSVGADLFWSEDHVPVSVA